jgi:hypothetical protein
MYALKLRRKAKQSMLVGFLVYWWKKDPSFRKVIKNESSKAA